MIKEEKTKVVEEAVVMVKVEVEVIDKKKNTIKKKEVNKIGARGRSRERGGHTYCPNVNCYNCGKHGHYAKDCRSTSNEEENVNLATEDEAIDHNVLMMVYDDTSPNSQHKRQPTVEKAENTMHDCCRCKCSGGAPRGHESSGADRGEFRRKSVVCYNCGREGHYARECQLKKEGYVMVAAKEKAPIDVESEEEHEGLATIAIADKKALESEEDIDFEPWFFDEAVEEETASTSCAVAVEKKPQERTMVEAITEESDGVVLMKNDAEVHVISRQKVKGRAIRRAKDRGPQRRQLRVPRAKLNSTIKQIEGIPKIEEWCCARKDYRYIKKHDDPDGRGVPKVKTNRKSVPRRRCSTITR